MGRSGYVPPPVHLFGKQVMGRPQATTGSKAEDSDYFTWVVKRWPFEARITHDAGSDFYWDVHLVWNGHDRVGNGKVDTLDEAVSAAQKVTEKSVRDLRWWLLNTPHDEDSAGSIWDRILRDD